MRVVHVDSARGWRGGQNQVRLTALGLRGRGHEVVVACQRGGILSTRARAEGLDVCAVSFRGDLWPPAAGALARLLRRFRPDVVHAHDPHALGAALLAVRVATARAVVASRRVDFPLRGRLSRWKYRACARVIAASVAIEAVLLRDGVPACRLAVVHEGVPDRPPTPGGDEVLRALGVPAGSPVVGCVAALVGHKDQATLIDATALLAREVPAVRVVLVGEGERRAALEARARERGVAAHVIFAGFRRDLDALLPAFTVFCLSSRTEGLGTSVLDAMAFGLPVVATAAGGIPEAVEDGVTGRLVPPGDAPALAAVLREVLGDAAERRRLGQAGRRRFLERFTAERMVEKTLTVYDGLR